MDSIVMAQEKKLVETLGQREFTHTEFVLMQRIYDKNRDQNRSDGSVPNTYKFDDYTHVLSKLNNELLIELKARFRKDPKILVKIQKVYDELKASGQFDSPTKEAVLAFNSVLTEKLGIQIDEYLNSKPEA